MVPVASVIVVGEVVVAVGTCVEVAVACVVVTGCELVVVAVPGAVVVAGDAVVPRKRQRDMCVLRGGSSSLSSVVCQFATLHTCNTELRPNVNRRCNRRLSMIVEYNPVIDGK